MIRVRKIAHAAFETPDLDRQVAYYTDILGLSLVAKDKDAAYLASTLDHQSVVRRRRWSVARSQRRRSWRSSASARSPARPTRARGSFPTRSGTWRSTSST